MSGGLYERVSPCHVAFMRGCTVFIVDSHSVHTRFMQGAKKDGKGPDGKSYLESASPEAQEALK